jgi:hypothetical protein
MARAAPAARSWRVPRLPKEVVMFFVPTLAVAIVLAATSASAISDHQQCFKIKDDIAKASYTLNLTPGDVDYAPSTGCTIKVPPKLFCIDAEKSGVTPTPPGAPDGAIPGKTLCYKLKCPAPPSPVLDTAQDQFGNHGLTVGKSAYICTPANPDFCLTSGDCGAVANGAAACISNVCGIGSCNAGFDDCNLDAADGCETDLDTDTNNCGNCLVACGPYPNAVSTCSSGACQMGPCDTGYGDCDVNQGTGCEAFFDTDTAHCGGCNLACPVYPNAETQCSSGTCQMGPCSAGYADCDTNPVTGCEIHTDGDENNCGGCNNVCPVSFPDCDLGACQ